MGYQNIFIAGSVQGANLYAVGNTNERDQMQRVVKSMLLELARYQVNVFHTVVPMTLLQSATEANTQLCTSYYAIHSNAGGGRGTTAIHQSSIYVPKDRRDKSVRMATELTNTIAGMGRINRGIYGRRNSLLREYYSDLRLPKMAACILETEFHDWDLGARWIIDNANAIGTNLAKAVCRVEGLVLRIKYVGYLPIALVSPESGTVANIKRWQVFLNWFFGIKMAVDGDFGVITTKYTKLFQKALGLEVDSLVGPVTRDTAFHVIS